MRILGIDPGIERTGWGVVDCSGQNFLAVDYNCIMTDPGQSLAQRLYAIHERVLDIIDSYSPEVLAVEELFFAKNAKTALIVGQARGVVIMVSGERKIPLEEVTPLQVKSTIVGYGNASKEQVGFMVKSLLGLDEIPRPDDVADALAIALACGIRRTFRAKIASSNVEAEGGRNRGKPRLEREKI